MPEKPKRNPWPFLIVIGLVVGFVVYTEIQGPLSPAEQDDAYQSGVDLGKQVTEFVARPFTGEYGIAGYVGVFFALMVLLGFLIWLWERRR